MRLQKLLYVFLLIAACLLLVQANRQDGGTTDCVCPEDACTFTLECRSPEIPQTNVVEPSTTRA
ncbi:hypothetical protein JZ751_021946 [Albula glossodonta]|uniref:Uncharacterized protein n=1 Tax=Albula glossodonta TaxID=121402 RepID=A0A8T2MZE8_9TELE|nr:hypothetical protein JZ751_021946 [Albula glossodonta]